MNILSKNQQNVMLCIMGLFLGSTVAYSHMGPNLPRQEAGIFLNRTSLLPKNPKQLNYGVAVSDIDNDGKMEWIVVGYGFRNLVLKWNGSKFVDITPEVIADRSRQAIGLAACDIDGDGREELYILNTDSYAGRKRFGDRLFAFRQGKWVDLFEFKQNKSQQNLWAGRSVTCVDREGDGRYEILVANYGGPMRLYRWSRGDQLTDIGPQAGINKITGGRAVTSAPLVSNRMDIFAANERGPNFLFQNQGDGTFKNIAEKARISDPRYHGRGVTILDANNDGYLDIIYGNWEGPHRMFIRTGNIYFQDRMPKDMAKPSRIRTVIAADFTNNGREEIFFNNIGQPNRLFGIRQGQWKKAPIGDALEPRGLGTGAAVADMDGDGRLELLISHGEAGAQPLTLYHSRTNNQNWIRVFPRTRYGAPARGAIVTLRTHNSTQKRVIDTGSGYLCQMEPIAHFGLGLQKKVHSIKITWPDGKSKTILSPLIRRTHVIRYPI